MQILQIKASGSRMGRVVLTTWVAMLLGLSVLLVQLRGDMPVSWRG